MPALATVFERRQLQLSPHSHSGGQHCATVRNWPELSNRQIGWIEATATVGGDAGDL